MQGDVILAGDSPLLNQLAPLFVLTYKSVLYYETSVLTAAISSDSLSPHCKTIITTEEDVVRRPDIAGIASRIPVLVVANRGGVSQIPAGCHYLTSPPYYQEALKTTAKLHHISPFQASQIPVPNYLPFKTSLLKLGAPAPCRIYQASKQNKMQILLYSGQTISQFLLNVLKKEKCGNVYIESKDRIRFAIEMAQAFAQNLKLTNPQNFSQSLQLITELATSMGVSSESIHLAELINSSIEKTLEKNQDLLLILQQTMNAQNIRINSILLAQVIALEALRKLGHSDRKHWMQLCVANLFKDMTLEQDGFLLIRKESKLKEVLVSERARGQIRMHPLLSSDILTRYYPKTGSLEHLVVRLVREHHGNPQGKSFDLSEINGPNELHFLSPLLHLSDELALKKLKPGLQIHPVPNTANYQLFQQAFSGFRK